MATEINRLLPDGKPFLVHAAARGKYDLVWLLIASDANPALRDSDGLTAFDYARRNNHDDVAYILQLTQLPLWNQLVEIESSVIQLYRELDLGKSLELLLNSAENSHLRELLTDNASFPNFTWFSLHKRLLIGYDEDNNLRWLINGKLYP